ncbi:NEDD4-binding protein 2 isoform X2 [Antennarius striatus]
MDSLLELSVAAEVADPVRSPVSGFEHTAAALLGPHHLSESRPDSGSSRSPQLPSSPTSAGFLTEELDLLVDQELEVITKEVHHNSQYLSTFPPPPFPQQVLPELLQSSLQPGSRGPFHISGVSSPLDQLSTLDDKTSDEQQTVVDFTHLVTEMPADRPKPPFDLTSSGHPSAFQVYKKKEMSCAVSDDTGGFMPSKLRVRGARSKVNVSNQEPSPWNVEAPVFTPCVQENQQPAFIVPVAQPPSSWPGQPRHPHWLSQGAVSKAPAKPFATIPKSWASSAPQTPSQYNRIRLQGKVLVLLRGAPGSGKSTMARALVEHNPGGVRLSTDDFFFRRGEYQYDPSAVGEAHEWNHKRAKEAFEKGVSPVIIDNTNMQGWEMRPYVAQALKHGYKILFREPDTWWKNKPRELERRTSHNVPLEKIRYMLNGFERFVTVQSIMGSQMPEFKKNLTPDDRNPPLASSDAPCPDLIGPPKSTEDCTKSQPQLCSSFPDVSSISHSSGAEIPEDNTHKSTECLDMHPTKRPAENPEMSDGDNNTNMGELDLELDAQLQHTHPIGDQRIPDCIVESVMNEDHCGDELTMTFSESRESPSRMSGFDKLEPVDLVKDTNQSEDAREKKMTNKEEADTVEMMRDGEEKGTLEVMDFVGDWPSQIADRPSLEQRQVRRRERLKERRGDEDKVSQEAKETKVQSGPTEFQKLLDLIQTGETKFQTDSSPSSSLSSGGEFEKEEEAGCTFMESCRSTSSSDETEQNMDRFNNNGSRSELPDCVLNWKTAQVSQSGVDLWEGPLTENRDRGENDDASRDTASLVAIPLSSLIADSPVETNANHNSTFESTVSYVGESCPVSEGTVEAERSGGSQERKQRQGRRSGKHCKLALTFTQNCLSSPENTPDGAVRNDHSFILDVDSKSNLECLTQDLHFFPECESEAQPPSLFPVADAGCFTQTEPQDFALLWRLNHQGSTEETFNAACCQPSGIAVLSGDSSRFVPGSLSVNSAQVAVDSSIHREVPYYVVHEKSTQVEDWELGTQDRLESLCILSRHFKLVSFDTLEDLYDKCHQDLEWTTNLLLDSGERFFKEDTEKVDKEDAVNEADQSASGLCGGSDHPIETGIRHDVFKYHAEEGSQGSTFKTSEVLNDNSSNADVQSFDTTSHLQGSSQTEMNFSHAINNGATNNVIEQKVALEDDQEGGTFDEDLSVKIEDIASTDEAHRLLQAELDRIEREEQQQEQEKTERRQMKERRFLHLDIQSVELKLSTEVALQLTELFGPVGVDPGACSADEYAVQMDLNVAKLLHQKWKETIQEKQRQATLSFHLLQESSGNSGELQMTKPGAQDYTQSAPYQNADGYASNDIQPDASGLMPFMNHWNVSQPHISLRDIMKEEQALQENMAKMRLSRVDLDHRNGATQLKENQLYSLFPSIDRHFLQDIFRDHNYNLSQTELFLRSLLIEEPVKTVVAPEAPRSDPHRPASKERAKKQKHPESAAPVYQDTEDPQYDDFRAEASLQRRRQFESLSKAAEAFKQGRKQVASFYAQQGHLHGKRMCEANHRAAVQIFERVNSSLLPNNILDLHGLHVNEALEHLAQVLHDKTTDCERGLCRPQLSVITGRGNHSQGGVARIRPAVIDYLTNRQYRFTEPKPGLVLVCLK